MPVHNNKISVIDLGTNTFHIVIFEKSTEGQITEIHRKRHHVFLSEGGIQKIGEPSLERAKTAILDFQLSIKKFDPDSIQIVGTAALRRASNGPNLKLYIENTLKTEVQVISGKREAELIAKGVQWEYNKPIKNALIMDIGGGSVEFIHIVNNSIQWLQSFPIGVGVLYSENKYSEPILPSEKATIVQYIEEKSEELLTYLETQKLELLFGASGSFELIPSIIEGNYPPKIKNNHISLTDFIKIRDRILSSTLEERLKIKGLPPVRAQLIVVAFILMDWILLRTNIQDIRISKYAVKEGLVCELFETKE